MVRKKDILKDAFDNYEEAIAYNRKNKEDALLSSRFSDGNQWPRSIKEERNSAKKPCITVNKLRKFILQVLGEILQNQPDLTIIPNNATADAAGASVRSQLIKYIEHISNADYAYHHAIQQALEGCYGYWRIVTDYLDNDSFDQNIIIKPVLNRFSVLVDPHAESKMLEDAEYGFFVSGISKKKAIRLYGKNIGIGFDSPEGTSEDDWYTEDTVKIAEYFWKEYKTSKVIMIQTGPNQFANIAEEDFLKQLEITPEISRDIRRERTIQTPIVKWCKMTRSKIVEGPQDFPGIYIPFIRMTGYEYNEEGYQRFRSLIHDGIDPMRMYNYWKTYVVEMIALAPKAPYIVTPKQIEGFTHMWKNANIESYPYLYYNEIGIGPPARQLPIPIPEAILTEATAASADIQDVIGMYAPSLGQPSNERTGRAILARQAQSNNVVFPFINNFQDALIHTGNIILKMIPTVYDSTRIIKVLGTNGLEELQLNYPLIDPRTLVQSVSNDMLTGDYTMVPTTTISSTTRRQQKVASMLDFLQFVPFSAPIIGPRLAQAMDWDGAETVAQELQSLVNPAPNPNIPARGSQRSNDVMDEML